MSSGQTQRVSAESLPYGGAHIDEVIRTLVPYGGSGLGFVVSPTEELLAESPTYEELNRRVALFVAAGLTRVIGRPTTYIFEDTKQMLWHSGEHCDGLNLKDNFLQVHNSRAERPNSPLSRAVLRAYSLSDSEKEMLFSLARARRNQKRIVNELHLVPHIAHSAIVANNTPAVCSQVDGGQRETIVFVNGCPAESETDLPRYYYTHEFSSVGPSGNVVHLERTVTFGRVEFVDSVAAAPGQTI